jgi:transposase-like protein
MAHGIKRIKIEKKDELECNNNQQSVNNINKMALNNLLLDNCCQQSSSNQSLINQKNSSTNTNAAVISTISTHQLLPPTQSASTLMNNNSNNSNKLSLNCGGASLSTITSSSSSSASSSKSPTSGTTKMGSRRIFTPQFKLQVLESYRNDIDCKGNQRATARKYGIHRRQIQKWLQCESNLRSIIANNPQNVKTNAIKTQTMQKATASAPILSSSTTNSRHRGVVVGANTDKNVGTYSCFTLTNAKSYKSNNNVGSSTKSLTPSSSSSFTDYSMNNNATVIETNRNNNFNFSPASCYDNVTVASATAPRLMYHHHHHQQQQQQEKVVVEDLPIDLSCNNRIIKSEAVARPIAIHPSSVDYKIPFLHHYMTSATSSSSSLSPPHHLTDISNSVVVVKSEFRNDPIDLSVANVSHKRKLSTDNAEKADKKPVKLFRPYLDDNFDKEENHHHQDEVQKFPLIWSNGSYLYNTTNEDYHHHHHHPSSHPFLMSVGSFYDHHQITTTPSPVLPLNDSGIHNSSFQTLMPPSQASPVSGYDSSTSSIYSYNENEADNSQGSSPQYTSSHYDAPSPFMSATMSPTTETKVPLLSPTSLHDLKFKLHALDCFYNDSECKGNEKLVANKLNINCKVVEKWLRHENDLRHQQKQYHLDILV